MEYSWEDVSPCPDNLVEHRVGVMRFITGLSPAVFKDIFYFYLGCPLPGDGPDGHLPSNICGFGPVSDRIRGVI